MQSLIKILFLAFLSLFVNTVSAQKYNDTIRLYFDLNISALNKAAQNKIDAAIYNDQIIPGENVFVVGYADYLGGEDYNLDLSRSRANTVADYLINNGMNRKDIKLCIGKGRIDRQGLHNPKGSPPDRKVDIVVKSNAVAVKKTPPAKKIPDVKTLPPVTTTLTNVDITDIKNIQPGQAIVLNKIYFLPERHHVTPESLPELEKLYNVLDQNPRLKIRIEGHVCCIVNFPDAYDMDSNDNNLSVNRARAIYDYLVGKGIDSSRLQYAGYGKSRPIVRYERNEEDAQKNRRVEIRILEK